MISRLIPLVLGVAVIVPSLYAGPVPTTVRVFQLRHCSVTEAAAAVEELLTEDGSLTVQPRKGRITVQDRSDVVERAAEVIATLDHPPGRFLIEVEILEGVQGNLPEHQRADVSDQLLRMFPFNAYRSIGVATFDGVMGEAAEADLGEGYRLSFLAESLGITDDTPYGIPRLGSRIHLEWLALSKGTEGSASRSQPSELFRTSVYLSENQELILGAGASESSKRGLVLILQALSVEGR